MLRQGSLSQHVEVCCVALDWHLTILLSGKLSLHTETSLATQLPVPKPMNCQQMIFLSFPGREADKLAQWLRALREAAKPVSK